jgi:pimeloyl-ACP methyl ester carboxylesterase
MGSFTYLPVEFTKDGTAAKPEQVDAVLKLVGTPSDATPLTDLIVISHGWNDDIPEAEALYASIFAKVDEVLAQANPVSTNVRARRAAVVGILWPSKKFDEASLTAGGAAAMTANDADSLKQTLDLLTSFMGTSDATQSLSRAAALVPNLASSIDARDEFVRIVRAFMPHDANNEEPVIADDLFTLDGDQLLQRLSRPGHDGAGTPGAGGATSMGGAAGLGDWIGKAVNGAKSLVNLVTYYQMKTRAGDVGTSGVYDMLRQIRAARPADGTNPLRLHLIGHSFGCRLVTAATAGPANTPPLPIDTLVLLQAAFSHYSFAVAYDGTHDGYFRRVVTDPTRVRGSLVITFTAKDKAVGLAYPIASRVARQIAAAIGDANDPYGGLGRNGAQKTPAVTTVTLGQVGTPYAFAARGIYNLDSNAVIGGHSDLAHPEVAYAIVSAVAVV